MWIFGISQVLIKFKKDILNINLQVIISYVGSIIYVIIFISLQIIIFIYFATK